MCWSQSVESETITLYPTQDTFEDFNRPTTPYCDLSYFAVGSGYGTVYPDEVRGFLDFDLSSIEGVTVESAELWLHCTYYQATVPAFDLTVMDVYTSWDECTLTHYNRPNYGQHYAYFEELPIGTGWKVLSTDDEDGGEDFLTIVQNYVDDPTGLHGFCLTYDSYLELAYFHSSNHGVQNERPYLVITYSTPPEPNVELTLEGTYAGSTPQASFCPGDWVTVKLEGNNIGDAVNVVTTLNVFDSTFDYPDTGYLEYDSHAEGEDQTSSLGNGETDPYVYTFQLRSDAPPGQYWVLGAIREQPYETGAVLDTTAPGRAVEDWSEPAYLPAFTVVPVGVTVITHGWRGLGDLPSWPSAMAQAVRARL